MKKILQEKRTLWKKIMSWILVMAILFTSADLSVFTVGAEEPVDFSSEADEDTEEPATAAESVTAEDTAETAQQDLTETDTEVFSDSADFSDSGEDLTEEIPQGETEELFTDEDIFSDGSVSQNGSEDFSSEEKPQEEQTEKTDFTLKVFEDVNKNGAWDEGENGITGLEAEVSLHGTEDKTAVQSVEPGIYSLNGLNKGIYTIRLLAEPEIISPYNLAESVNLSPDKEKIQFPDVDDTWVLSWTEINLSQTKELFLGLQRDDLAGIEEEIGDAGDVELQTSEEGVFFAAAPSGRAANGFLKREYIYYKDYQVDVWFDNGNPAGFSGCPSYRWIFRASDNKILYCIEPFVNGIDNGNYSPSGNMTSMYGTEKAKRMQLYAYYGAEYAWPGAREDWNIKALYFMAAQNLIWKEMGAQHLQWYQYKGDYHGHFHSGYAINTKTYEDQILNKLNNHYKVPSLPANQRIDHDYTNPDKVYSFTDSNGALGNGWQSTSYYNEGWWVKSIPAGVQKAWIEGNQLKFTLKNDPAYDGKQITFPLEKWFYSQGGNQFYVSNKPRQQSLMTQGNLANIPYNWTVTINPTGQLKIQKVDDAGNPVPGVTFRWGITKDKLDHVTAATGTDGTITIRANVGTIYVKEESVPEHLIIDPVVKSVNIKDGQTSSVTFTNTRVTRNVSLRKINSVTGKPIGGAEFQYWNKENPSTKYTAVTGSNGEFISSVKFPVGSQVTMKEIKAAPGYELPSGSGVQKTITISMDEAQNVFEFENLPKSIPLKLKKINARTGKPICGGVKFKVGTDLNEEGSFEYVVTDSDGIAETEKKYAHGTRVYYQEIETPPGFHLDDSIFSVVVDASKSDQVFTVTVENREIPLSISIKKKGDDGRLLAGVRFRLEQKFGNGWYTMHSDLVTDKNGVLKIPGTYSRKLIAESRLRLVEEETIPGYQLLKEPYVFEPSLADTEDAQIEVIIINEKRPTRLVIKKIDQDTNLPLAGAVFEITDKNGKQVQLLTTDSKGQAQTADLMSDTIYYIEEITPPYGYKKLEGRQQLKLDSTNNFKAEREYSNEAYYGKIKVHKKDQNGKNLKGIEFTIYKGSAPVETLITDENGYAESKQPLPATDTYRIVETYAPPQYVGSGLNYSFRFLETEDGKVETRDSWTMTFEKNSLTASFDVTNEEIFGEIAIEKTDADDETVKVKGAEFDLRNRYTGKLVDKGTTDEKGLCTFKNVPLVNPVIDPQQGYYYIEETSPGENHILPENTKKYVSLTAASKKITVKFENPPYKGSVEIKKVDKDNPSKTLAGAEFTIYSEEDLTKPLQTTKTKEDGIARFDGLRYGSYVIKETKAPLYYRNNLVHGGNEGYWDADIKGYRVTIKENGQLIPLTITNEKLQVRVKVVKYARGKNTLLGGAEFNLCQNNGKVLETLITSPIDGSVYSKTYFADELGEGAYLIETKAPAGYEISSEKIPVEFTDQSETPILEIVKEIENNMKEPNFRFQKVDEYGDGVDSDFTIDVYNITDNKNWADYQHGFPYGFNVTKDNSTVSLSGFFDSFQKVLDRHSENTTQDVYRLTFKETKTDDKHQIIPGILAELNMSFGSDGWYFDATDMAEGVTFDKNTMILTAVNRKKTIRLNIVKHENKKSSKYLAEARFRITPIGMEDKAVEVVTTGTAEGVQAELPYVDEYLIEELEAPDGYFLMNPKIYKVEELDPVTDPEGLIFEATLKIGDFKCPDLKIKKTDDQGDPVQAEFEVGLSTSIDGTPARYITVATDKNGDGVIDISSFSDLFLDKSVQRGDIIIRETKVGSAYVKLEEEIRIRYIWTKFGGFLLDKKSGFEKYVEISEDSSSAIITVPNPKKEYAFKIRKLGENGESDVHAKINIINQEHPDRSEEVALTNEYVDVTNLFSGFAGNSIQFNIEELETDTEFQRLYLNPAFFYHPNEEDDKKFQQINEHISITPVQDGKTITFEITLKNPRAIMRLPLKKTDENGNPLAGAAFKVTTKNPDFSNVYVTTGDPNGDIFEFPYANSITLEEIAPPPGYEIMEPYKWELDASDFTPIDSNHSVYECRQFLDKPIQNKRKYDLTIRKSDEEGQTANATFSIVATDQSNEELQKWNVPTENGVAKLNFIIDYLLDTYPSKGVVNLKVTEIATDEGLLLQDNSVDITVFLTNIINETGNYFLYNFYGEYIKENINSGTTLDFTVKNAFIPVNLTVIKKEEGSEPEKYLAGAEFTITPIGKDPVILKTTAKPTGDTVKLPWAESYTVQETKAPEGYIMDPVIYDYTIKDFQNQMDAAGKVLLAKNLTVTKTNTPVKGKLQVIKVDAEDQSSLAGAIFEIYKGSLNTDHTYDDVKEPAYTEVGTIKIQSDGTGISEELPYGNYLLKETKAPDGYDITKEIYETKISRDKETVYIQIPNKRSEGKLTIIKKDASDSKSLAGAVFTVHREDTHEQVGDKLTTGVDGTVSMTLPYGRYYIKEVSFPSGYASASGKTYPFELSNQVTEVESTILNTRTQYALRLFKTDKDTGEFLAGAVFGVYEDNADPQTAQPVQKFTTNANGSAVVFLAIGGHYDIYELESPIGYQKLDQKFEVYVDDTEPAVEITVENVKQNLTIEIYKKDQNSQPLPGAVFEIRNAKTGELVVTTEPTSYTGSVTVSVPAGDYEYTVTEIAAPDGYVLDSAPKPVTVKKEEQIGSVIYKADPVEIINYPIQGNIKLVKLDKDTRIPLEGAVFGVYDSDKKLVDTLTTNSKGEAMSKNHPSGSYTLKELTPPPGYQLSDVEYAAVLKPGENLVMVTADNTPLKGGFTVKKVDPENPDKKLEGAVFAVYSSYEDAEKQENPVKEESITSKGTAVFSDLSYGTYFVREKEAPKGYELNERIFTVTVDGDSADEVVLTVENHKKPEKGIFRVRKKDKDTGSALAGAEFTVIGSKHSKVYTTGEDGTFQTDELEPGTYTVTETKPPKGYRISENPTKTVDVKAGEGILSEAVEYEFLNEKIQFPIRIVKTDDNSSAYKPLTGAVFELYRLNEQNVPDALPLETLVTGMDGTALSMMLSVGKYRVKEIKAPDGYQLSEPLYQDIEIKEDIPQEIPDFTLTFRNSPELGSLKIRKLGLPSKEADSSQGIPLAGAVFEAVKADTGETYQKTSGEDGWAVFENLSFGIYNVREIKVPDGYENDSAYYETVEIGRKDNEEGPVVIEKTALNYKIYGSLKLKKTDSETEQLVAGAVYGIYKELKDGDVVESSYMGSKYDLYTVQGQTYVSSEQLNLGTYYVKELISPPGYEMNPFVYTAEITEETPVIFIDAEDTPIKGKVSVHKEDENGNSLEGAVFALYTREEYDRLQKGEAGIPEETPDPENDPQVNEEKTKDLPDVQVSYLTTDADGNAYLDNLTLGQEYVLTEFSAPAGYQLEFETRFFTLTPDKKEIHYNAVNKKKRELIIHKVNEQGDPISDVMFTVYKFGPDGKPDVGNDDPEMAVLSPGITGDGIARLDISDFENGWYYVKETQGSDMGYEISQEIITFEITDDKKEYEFTFVNYRPKGEIEIQKKDELGNPLPAAEFKLYMPGHGWYDGSNPDDVTWVADFTLNEMGYGILKDIEASVYVIRETKAPEGYKPINDILVVMHRDGIEQEKNGRVYYHYHKDIVNKPITGWISIQKKAIWEGQLVKDMDLSNARFEIRDKDQNLVDTVITGKDGKAVSRELPMGTYTIQETEAPQGTVLNKNSGTVIIDGQGENDIYEYQHENTVVKGRIQITKTDGETAAALNGAEFDILPEGSDVPADQLRITDHGVATSKDLPYGWYVIRETKAPEGYALQIGDIRCQVREDNEIVEVTVKNFKSKETEILVVKYDKDNPNHYLPGAQFNLYGDKTLNTQIGDTFATDSNGKITFGAELDLQAGETYYLKEIEAPEGYVLDETVHSFTLSEPVQSIALYIPNEKEKGYIRFEKTGEMLTRMEEDKTWPNLYKLVWEQQTLKDAEIGIYAKDIVSLDGKTYQKGDLIQRLRSDEVSRSLPLGTYLYKELSAPKGYILDDKFHDVVVSKDHVEDANPAIAAIENTHTSVSLELVKKFQNGNTKDKLDKVKFGVFAASTITSNGVQIPEGTLLGIIKVDESGHSINNKLKLPEGSYYVMEMETAEGYVLDGRRYPFTTGYQNKDQTIEISSESDPIINEPIYGTIRLEKTGDMFTRVEKLVNQEGGYQINRPVYEKGMLKGAEFQIRAKDKVTIGDKTYQPNEVIDTLITGIKDESMKLPLGTYILVETKAPDGYILNSEEIEVAILPNEIPTKPSVAVRAFENEKAVPKITLYKSFFGKTDAEAKDFYTEVLFGIYAGDEIKGASNDAVLKKDDLVGLIRINENGTGTPDADTKLPFGKYYIKELETAEGYQLSEEKFAFEVTKDNVGVDPQTGNDLTVSIEGISQETPIINLPEGAEVPFAFRKTDEEGKPLAGAEFRLYTCEDKNAGHNHTQEAGTEGSCWKEISGLSPKVSGADGIVDFGILPDGDYQLKETEAPDGYVLPAGQWRFTVDSTVTSGEHIIFTSTDGAKPPAFQKAEDGAVYQYQVSNRKAMPMPFTGGAGLPAYLGGGGALVALSELMRRRRKNKK